MAFHAFNRNAFLVGGRKLLMALRAKAHQIFLFELSLGNQLLDAPGRLREQAVTAIASAKRFLMAPMGERNIPETTPMQDHILCSDINFTGSDRHTRRCKHQQHA